MIKIKHILQVVVVSAALSVGAIVNAAEETKPTSSMMGGMNPMSMMGGMNPMSMMGGMNPMSMMGGMGGGNPMGGMMNPMMMMMPMMGMGGMMGGMGGGNPMVGMMNPSSWTDLNAYKKMMNPMAYMNPMSYMAFMNPNTYMQMMNPSAYMQMMNNIMGLVHSDDDKTSKNFIEKLKKMMPGTGDKNTGDSK